MHLVVTILNQVYMHRTTDPTGLDIIRKHENTSQVLFQHNPNNTLNQALKNNLKKLQDCKKQCKTKCRVSGSEFLVFRNS